MTAFETGPHITVLSIAGELLGAPMAPWIIDMQFCIIHIYILCSSEEFKGLKPHFVPAPILDWHI